MNFEIRGWNECLITYVLGASSPTYPITENVYHKCWADSNHFINGKEYYRNQTTPRISDMAVRFSLRTIVLWA